VPTKILVSLEVDMADKQRMEAEGAEGDSKELLNKRAVSARQYTRDWHVANEL
jgi:hypothetical protein